MKIKTMPGALAQALARHKAAQAAIDAHSGCIDDHALANQLFAAESDALEALAEAPCGDAELVEKLRRKGMMLRLRYLTLKLRALCWVLQRLSRYQLTQY